MSLATRTADLASAISAKVKALTSRVASLETAGTGGAALIISSVAPTGKPDGTEWLDTNTGIRYTQYNDGNSVQWVQFGVASGAANTTVSMGIALVPPSVEPDPPTLGGILFNRTIAGRNLPAYVGPSGLSAALQPYVARNKIAWIQPNGNSTTISSVGTVPLAVGTATVAPVATTNLHYSMRRVDYLINTASSSAIAGWRGPALQWWMGNAPGLGGFTFIMRYGFAAGTSVPTTRSFVGMSAMLSSPTDVNPSTFVNMVGFGWDSGDDNMQFMCNDGSAVVKTDLGPDFPRPTTDRATVYEVSMFSAPNSGIVTYQLIDLGTGSSVTGTAAKVPPPTVLLSPRGWISVGGTSSTVGFALMSAYLETDN